MKKTTFIILLLLAHFLGYVFGRQDQSMKDYTACEVKIEQAVQDAKESTCDAQIEDILAQF